MSSAALHSRKLLQDYEDRAAANAAAKDHRPYPAPFPFGGEGPGPFGGASRSSASTEKFVAATATIQHPVQRSMSSFADVAASSMRVSVDPGQAWADSQMSSTTSALMQPQRDISQYDYPAGWGATTQAEFGGLTQDSASRIATLQAKLNQKLGPEYLSQRPGPGGGKKLTYIEGWKLIDLANEVFGFNGWSTTIVRLDVDYLDCSSDGSRFNAGVSCVIRVTLRDGAFHEDVGYGSAENAKQKHAAIEKCKKEAVTDATKRALKNFGKLLGNCTYDHSFAKEAFKVPIPHQKFDPSELHRRTDSKPPAPLPSRPAASTSGPSEVMGPPAVPRPVRTSTAPAQNVVAPPAVEAPASNAAIVGNRDAGDRSSDSISPPTAQTAAITLAASTESKQAAAVASAQARAAAERQERSQAARAAYLQKQLEQQAQAQNGPNGTSPSAATSDLRRSRTEAPGRSAQHDTAQSGTAQTLRPDARPDASRVVGAGRDEFGDDILDDALCDYDETDIGDAEVASMALEMEIEAAAAASAGASAGDASRSAAAHDDSGVQFADDTSAIVQVKMEKVAKAADKAAPGMTSAPARRSLSPVKQVQQQDLRPRRAGSVGRFLSPPPDENDAYSSNGAATAKVKLEGVNEGGRGRNQRAAHGLVGGIEGGPMNPVRRDTGRAVGRPVGHTYIAARGTKRNLEEGNGSALAPGNTSSSGSGGEGGPGAAAAAAARLQRNGPTRLAAQAAAQGQAQGQAGSGWSHNMGGEPVASRHAVTTGVDAGAKRPRQ